MQDGYTPCFDKTSYYEGRTVPGNSQGILPGWCALCEPRHPDSGGGENVKASQTSGSPMVGYEERSFIGMKRRASERKKSSSSVLQTSYENSAAKNGRLRCMPPKSRVCRLARRQKVVSDSE